MISMADSDWTGRSWSKPRVGRGRGKAKGYESQWILLTPYTFHEGIVYLPLL